MSPPNMMRRGGGLPLQGSLLQSPARPVAPSGISGDAQRFSSSQKLVGGDGVVLANLMLPLPSPIGVYVAAPLLAQDPLIQNTASPIIENVAGTQELWVLGTCSIGMGGTKFSFDFDIPLSQVVQLQVVAQTLEIRARIIKAKIGLGGGGGPASVDFSQPDPAYTGDIKGGSVFVQAFCGEGVSCASNASRRARIIAAPVQAEGITIFPPPFATMARVLCDPAFTVKQIANKLAGGAGNFFVDLLPVNSGQDLPIIDNCKNFNINTTGGAVGNVDAEVLFRLGLSGLLS